MIPDTDTTHKLAENKINDNIVKGITGNIMHNIFTHLMHEVTQATDDKLKLKESLIIPIWRLIQTQMMPYITVSIVFVIFVTILSISNLIFSILIYVTLRNFKI